MGRADVAKLAIKVNVVSQSAGWRDLEMHFLGDGFPCSWRLVTLRETFLVITVTSFFLIVHPVSISD